MKNNNDFISEMKRISIKYGNCDIESCLKEISHLKEQAKVDGPTYEAGRLEGRADIAVKLRKILDPNDENKLNIDGLLEKVEDNSNLMLAMTKELNKLCGWEDESFLHAYLFIGNYVKNLRAELEVEKKLREKAESNYEFMVRKAIDKNLDGYRELGMRAARAENELDILRSKIKIKKS